jgi:hypothetical protein
MTAAPIMAMPVISSGTDVNHVAGVSVIVVRIRGIAVTVAVAIRISVAVPDR